MINEESVKAVDSAQLNGHFKKPLYESYCFSQIPQTVMYALTGEGEMGLPVSVLGELPRRYNKIIVVFVDAFGWRFVTQYLERYPFLQRFAEQGVVSKLTSQFPSTTAAHTTTIHTGLSVGRSGVHEWNYYEPLVDRVISPLLFSYSGDKQRETLRQSGVAPEAIFPMGTIYERLAERGVKSYGFQNRMYTPSPFSNVVFRGAKTIPYVTFFEALTNLTTTVNNSREKVYCFIYYDVIDALMHLYGPESPQAEAEIDIAMIALERLLQNKLTAPDTLLLIIADHGQVAVSPETTMYLNLMDDMPLVPLLRTNRQGELLVPAGSPRDMFLYIEEDRLDEAKALLAERLEGRAEVYAVADLITQGFFGAVSERFLQRVGNLVLLPYAGETVWWYERGKHEQNFHGHHGGLTPQEMETMLLAMAY